MPSLKLPPLKLFVKALRYQILTLATTHLIISYILMVTRDYNEGNLFRILNYNKLFPEIGTGLNWFIISSLFAVVFFLVYFLLVIVSDRRKKTSKSVSASK